MDIGMLLIFMICEAHQVAKVVGIDKSRLVACGLFLYRFQVIEIGRRIKFLIATSLLILNVII
jgi:hypothetical protein